MNELVMDLSGKHSYVSLDHLMQIVLVLKILQGTPPWRIKYS